MPDLPLEVVILIARAAADDARLAWLANLSLVCKALKRALDPILYRTFYAGGPSYSTFNLSRNPSFQYTRNLVIANGPQPDRVALERAFPNIDFLAIYGHTFLDLCERRRLDNLRSMSLRFDIGYDSVTRVQLVVHFDAYSIPHTGTISGLVCCTHALFDVILAQGYNQLHYDRSTHLSMLTRFVRDFAKMPDVRRLVCRLPFRGQALPFSIHYFWRANLGNYAREARDERWYYDDASLAGSEYAMPDDDAWERGVQMYRSEEPDVRFEETLTTYVDGELVYSPAR